MGEAAGRKAAAYGLVVVGTALAFWLVSGCSAFRTQTKVVEKPANVMVRTLEEKSMKVQYMDKATGELKVGTYRVPAGSWIVSGDYVSASEKSEVKHDEKEKPERVAREEEKR
ncbi:hypothetical protein [Prosthecochloris sp.]|uniref:hypothetical protein n=1 Tax=Prosthecochloris sp. TaxID=290513 RepID=UPI00257E1476|nr:hypothetical protein [Prosthecochloris sp.]